MVSFMLGFMLWSAIAFALLGLGEYFVHVQLEHRKVWGFHWLYELHHMGHHQRGEGHAGGIQIDFITSLHLLVGSPILGTFIVVALYDLGPFGSAFTWGGFAAWLVVVVIQCELFTTAHRVSHDIEPKPYMWWFVRTQMCRDLIRFHHDHHRDHHTNFGVLYAVWMRLDRLFGTEYTVTRWDVGREPERERSL